MHNNVRSSRNFENIENNLRPVAEDPAAVSASLNVDAWTEEFLKRLNVTNLKLLARRKGYQRGTSAMRKDDLIAHFLACKERGGVSEDEDLESLESYVIRAWFIKPLKKNRNLLKGSRNEPYVIKALGNFLEKEANDVKLKLIKTYGLVCRRDFEFIDTSPDGVAVLEKRPETGGLFICALEIKTMTVQSTVAKARHLAATFGPYTTTHVNTLDFMEKIPNRDHRIQILHHATVLKCSNVLYVVSSSNNIIRGVNIRVPENFRERFIALFYLLLLIRSSIG